jgi:hypothetical protein
MRDAGLSIKAWLDVNDNDYGTVATEVGAYAGWVETVQHKVDPNGIDVRVEPKFTIPDAEPYTGGWCRPQTDGPGESSLVLKLILSLPSKKKGLSLSPCGIHVISSRYTQKTHKNSKSKKTQESVKKHMKTQKKRQHEKTHGNTKKDTKT